MIAIGVDPDELKRAKAIQAKNRGPEMYEGREGNRWIGHASELAFARWMRGKKIHFEHFAGSMRKEFDFLIGGVSVEMKTQAASGIPQIVDVQSLCIAELEKSTAAQILCAAIDVKASTTYILGFVPLNSMDRFLIVEVGERVHAGLIAKTRGRVVPNMGMDDPEKWLARFIPSAAIAPADDSARIKWTKENCFHCLGSQRCECVSCWPSTVCVVCA